VNIVAPAIVKRYAKGADSDVTDAMVVNALDRKGGGADDNDAQAGHLIAGTVRSHPRPGSNDSGGIVTHTLRAEGFDASEDGTGRGTPLTVDPLVSRSSRGKPTPLSPGHNTDTHVAITQGQVRRLSPSECEVLQGFPRGWTLLEPDTGWRSYPQPDGRRYAACGDAVTVNVAFWIGRRLMAADQETNQAVSEKAPS
jgi:DNA (cytosine-5)-methyltransferase 1